jgi:hypothetical protein
MLKHELRIHSFREELETRKFLVFNTIVKFLVQGLQKPVQPNPVYRL